MNLETKSTDLEEPRGTLRCASKRAQPRAADTKRITSSDVPRAPKGREGLQALADAFIARLRVRAFAAGTLVVYAGCLADFIAFMVTLGIADARGVLRMHIDRYGASLVARELATCTRSQRLRVVHAFFADLVARGSLLVNPVGRIRSVERYRALPKRVPSEGEVTRLIDDIDTSGDYGKRDRAVLELLYGSALRASELVAVAVEDIDVQRRVVRVTRGKGGRERRVPLTATSCSAIERYLRDVRVSWAPRGERALFVTKRGSPMSTWVLRALIERHEARAEIACARAHAFRHAAATHMVSAGADIRFVQEMLGHADVTTTQIYTRVRPLDVKKMHQRTHPREVAP